MAAGFTFDVPRNQRFSEGTEALPCFELSRPSRLATSLAAPAWAITGNLLPLNSGADSGTDAQLDNNGCAGHLLSCPR